MFHVEWLQSALDELAAVWTPADHATRQAITAASHRIEQLLRTDPRNQGESRLQGEKITFEPPLAVLFRLESDGETVTVLHIRLFRRRKQ